MNTHAIGSQYIGGGQIGSAAPSVTPSSATVLQGGTATLTAANFTGGAVTWSSANGAVFTVNASTGVVTGVGPGTSILATATGVSNPAQTATCAITVPVVVVSISPTTSSLGLSGTQQFAASVTGAVNTSVTWTGTGGVSYVGGLFTALGSPGSGTIVATSVADATKSATGTITVSAVATYLSGVRSFGPGLVGTVGYQVYGNGTTFGARITAGIVERPVGVYRSPNIIAPVGQLIEVIWDDASGHSYPDWRPQQLGVALAPYGLDLIPTTAPANQSNPTFRQMVVMNYRRWFRKADVTGTGLNTLACYADDGTTVIATQLVPPVLAIQTQGAAT